MPDRVGQSEALADKRERRRASEKLAWTLWNMAFLYGNVPAAKMAVGTLSRYGWPTAGMVELVEDHWRGVPAALTGWACHPTKRRGEAPNRETQAPLPASVSATREGSQRGRNEG